MKNLIWASRHTLTQAQRSLLEKNGQDIVHVDFGTVESAAQIKKQAEESGLIEGQLTEISGVFPLDILAELIEAGVTVHCLVTTERGLRVDQATPNQLKLVTFKGQ